MARKILILFFIFFIVEINAQTISGEKKSIRLSTSKSNEVKKIQPFISMQWEYPSMDNLIATSSNPELSICVKSSSPIDKILVMVNDVEAKAERGIDILSESDCNYTIKRKINLSLGENAIIVELTNKDGSVVKESRKMIYELKDRRLALIIGNANYLNASPLTNPINDADAIAEALTKVGFEVIKKENCDQKTMKQAMDEFGDKLKSYDVGLFYYAGHGMQVKGLNFLIPVDAKLTKETDVEYDCVDAGRLLGKMEGSGTKTNIVILDACRNNPFERSWASRSGSAGSGLAFMNAPSGSIIAYATSPGKTASDGSGKNGLYTEAFLKQLNTPGVSIEQVFKNVRIMVEEKSNGMQTPWESTSLKGDFFFTK